MEAIIKDGKLIITIAADVTNPRPSKSGKTRIVASSNGNITTKVLVDGKPLIIGLNAYIK